MTFHQNGITKMDNLPTTFKAQVAASANGKMELKELDMLMPGPNQVLVNVLYSGVCRTDYHVWKDELPLKGNFPLIGGHEGVGNIAAMGENVKDFKLGDTVGIKFINSSCLNCEMCKQGFEPNCSRTEISGLTVNGTFTQYCLVDAVEAARIPDGCDLSHVAPILCAGLTAYKALKQTNLQQGRFVAISGAMGGLGTLAIQYAKAMGLRPLALDLGDKEKVAKELGAEFYIDTGKYDEKGLVEAIRKCTDGGPHGVVVLSPAESSMHLATEYVRTRGIVVLVSLPEGAILKANAFWTVIRAVTIRGSYVGSRIDMDEALDFFKRGLIKAPVKVEPLSNLPDIFERMGKFGIVGRIVVDTSK